MKRLFYFALLLSFIVLFISCSKSEKGAAPGTLSAAPSFTITDADNKKVSLGDYKGKVVMVEFFATWCPPCQMLAPTIRSAYEKYKDRGFVVLAIAVDNGPDAASVVRSFEREFGLTYPVLIDDGMVSRQYEVNTIPMSFLIDRQGKIKNKHTGLVPGMPDVLSKEIEALL